MIAKKELLDGLMQGKIRTDGDSRCYYAIDHEHGPFIFERVGQHARRMNDSWEIACDDNWYWEEPKKTRPMTRDEVLHFVANTQGIVIRYMGEEWDLPSRYSLRFDMTMYEWSYSSPTGEYEPHKFEVEVDE